MRPTQRTADARYMKRALSLARKGRGKVSPNPMVGCVIVKDGRIVGEGFHDRFGGPHAELAALAQAGPRARGATLYSTLEPCDHYGKTPPCTRSIISAGVARVVTAMLDPNPRVRGRGISRLRRNSLRVSLGPLGAKARSLNAAYVRSWKQHGVRVIAKAAMTLDGKIATRTGDSKWITSNAARILGYRTRSSVDAVLVGRTTIREDNPALTAHGFGPNPVRVVIDPAVRTSLTSAVYNHEAPTVLVHCVRRHSRKLEDARRKGVLPVYLSRTGGAIPFYAIIRKLREFGIRQILIEGGGETLAGAFAAGVVTDVMFFVAPRIFGGRVAKTPVEGPGVAFLAGATRLAGMRAHPVGPDILLTAQVLDNERKRRT